MTFIKNHEEVARSAIKSVDPQLEFAYAAIIAFLAENPDAASNQRGKNTPEKGSESYIRHNAGLFAKSRDPRAPKPPETVPDEMVSVILESYFDIPNESLPGVQHEHSLSMAAENLIGELLERYIASVLEEHGWVWCSGSLVRAVDFIKPPKKSGGQWELLQVKNRDNSENSSSSAIRTGTTIKKWHRTFAHRKETNWGAFPDEEFRPKLSEAGFKKFVIDYLKTLRSMK